MKDGRYKSNLTVWLESTSINNTKVAIESTITCSRGESSTLDRVWRSWVWMSDRCGEGSQWSLGSNWNWSNISWQRSGAGLIWPRVVGEPGTESKVLTTGGVSTVNIAPSCSCAVSWPAVALDGAILILEGEWGTLATNVDIGGGSLGVFCHLWEWRGGDAGGHSQDCANFDNMILVFGWLLQS